MCVGSKILFDSKEGIRDHCREEAIYYFFPNFFHTLSPDPIS